MNTETPKKKRITTIPEKPLPPSPLLFVLRVLGILVIPIAMTAIAVRAPAQILIGLAALTWIFAIALLIGFDAFRPRSDLSYLAGVSMLVCGVLSFGGSVLFEMSIAMSPIGREAPLVPFFFFGGLVLQLAGFVALFGGHKWR